MITNIIFRRSDSPITSDKPHYENVPFEIPDNWVWTTLGEIFTLQAGKNITAKDIYTEKSEESKYPCFGGNGIRGYVAISNKIGEYPIIGRQGALCGNINLAHGIFYATEHAVVVERYCDTDLMWGYYTLIALNLNQYATATAQPGLAVNVINDVAIPLPPLHEQQRISKSIKILFSFLEAIECKKLYLKTAISQTKTKVLDLAIHGRLVPQDPTDEPATELLRRINPKAEITSDNGHYQKLPKGWAVCQLDSIISYEQPTPYIVKSTDYDDTYTTPVLTAGRSFIIGHTNETNGVYEKLPCIIFDDFTTDSKLVDFPFKVKSSAMKILQVKEDINIEYIAMFMSITRLIGDTHKRYWISEYSKIEIPIPPKNEQDRIIKKVRLLLNRLGTITENL